MALDNIVENTTIHRFRNTFYSAVYLASSAIAYLVSGCGNELPPVPDLNEAGVDAGYVSPDKGYEDRVEYDAGEDVSVEDTGVGYDHSIDDKIDAGELDASDFGVKPDVNDYDSGQDVPDIGLPDTYVPDTSHDAGVDIGQDVPLIPDVPTQPDVPDAGEDTGIDAGEDVPQIADVPDIGLPDTYIPDTSHDAGQDVPDTYIPDTSHDAGQDIGIDTGVQDTGRICVENATRPYYTGPSGTSGKGECKDGQEKCISNAWVVDIQQITPIAEICSNGKDDNCNDVVDDGCVVNLNITVNVKNVVTDANLSGIEVLLNTVSQTTNTSGNAVFSIPAGTYTMKIRDEATPGVIGSYFDKEISGVNLTTSTTLNEELIENYTAPAEYANFLQMFKTLVTPNICARYSSYPVNVFAPNYTNGSGINYTLLVPQGLHAWEDATAEKPGFQLAQQVATEAEAKIIYDYSQDNSSTDPYINADGIIEDAIIYIRNTHAFSDWALGAHKHELGHALGHPSHNLNTTYIMRAGEGPDIPIQLNEGRMIIITSTMKDRDIRHHKED